MRTTPTRMYARPIRSVLTHYKVKNVIHGIAHITGGGIQENVDRILPHGIRAVCICPSEVQTNWGGKTGRNDPNKLFASDIADAILAALSANRRALWPEFAVFATNPWQES